MPLHVCFSSALPFRPAATIATARCTRQSFRFVRACARRSTHSSPSSSTTKLTASKPSPLVNRSDTPAIFNGPEAVLAVLLAAAALLADFVRNVARLSTAGVRSIDVGAAERSVAELREALKISREVLDETESRFNAVTEQRADVHNALMHADRLREKMQAANLYAQSAEKQLLRVQSALDNMQQKRLNVAQEKERVDEERQRVETQIVEKRLLIDKLCEQIESAKQREREIIKQIKYQQQLLDRQLSENVGDAEKEQNDIKGGDSSRSEMSLQEIKRNLRAEKLALSAEIREARVASDALSEDDVDSLKLLKREMKAKQDGMRARLNKAQTTVDREEKEIERREDAIDNILDSVGNDDDESLLTEGAAVVDNKNTVKKSVRKAQKKEVVEKEVSAEGESKTTAKKKKAGKSNAEEEAIGGSVDSSKSEEHSAKAKSTSTTKEVKKRTRTRKQASSADSGSVSTASKTRKRKTTRKKRSEQNEGEPLTAQEEMEVRKAMIDILGDGADVKDLPQGGETTEAGTVAVTAGAAEEETKRAKRAARGRRSSAAGDSSS